ncbi:exodeoxyribonuclease III [Oceanibaculum indicum]|uniref:Exodeoxyribonuclease III n=1 Tax=Oceanibaculum indicum P24 TaxID=1207063 RepID=K2JLH3_9PROT|nr:exodeoxyribonuclease III [Oceanibaculum indicum]EKE75257.1 exodeoxyribonuclease III [Oceanibaculum indicum P24]
MKIATFNVNSIKARLPNVLEWLKEADPDVALLQEIKCQAADFPVLEFQSMGYQVQAVGQKSYNGVALLSKQPAENVLEGLPGDDSDEQARYVEATVQGVRVASLYLPNGNPVDSEKYPYKLGWMKRLKAHAATLLASEQPVVLAGDYNVIPEPRDCYDPAAWAGDALFLPETRRHFREIVNLGYTDAFRAIHPQRVAYSFWDYQAGRWPRDEGIRIDHLLLSPQAADRLRDAGIDKKARGREKASDHTPVWCELDS